MRPFTHVILTRFNVRVDAAWSKAARDESWLEHRFGLFEGYCLPSLAGQSEPGFVWLVFFDAETPARFRERVEACRVSLPSLTPVYIPRFADEFVQPAVAGAIRPGSTHLLSTRLDNDDALHRDHVRLAQSRFDGQALRFLNFSRGYILREGRLYLFRDESNAFCSLIERLEPGAPAKTVWCAQHHAIAEAGPVEQIEDPPAWLQVVHGKNVSNRVRGERRPLEELRRGFALQAEIDASRDTALDVLLDRAALQPLRGAREAARSAAKRARDALRGRATT